MELWFILAVASAVFSGFFTFAQKLGVELGYNSSQMTRWILTGQLVTSCVYFIVWDYSFDAWQTIVIGGAVAGVLYAVIHYLRALSLEHIDTAIYFPLNKFLGPLLVALIGIVVLQEDLMIWDYLGIVIGAMVPLMLLDKFEKDRQKNLIKGIQIMLASTVISAGAVFVARAVVIDQGSIGLFTVVQSIVGVFVLLINERIRISTQTIQALDKNKKIRLMCIGIIGGSMTALSIFTILEAIRLGSISVVYTINSFYILVPIVLSVWLFNDHINIRKGIAIGLSILAVIFFQI